MTGPSIGTVARNATFAAIIRWVVGLGLSAIVAPIILRNFPLLPRMVAAVTVEEWALGVAFLLAVTLLFIGAADIVRAAEPLPILVGDAMPTLPLAKWLPDLATVDHGGYRWSTTMQPFPEAATGRSYNPEINDVGVEDTPLCIKCSNTLHREEGVLGCRRYYCVTCGWSRQTRRQPTRLHAEAVTRARGAYREYLKVHSLIPGVTDAF